MRFPLPVSLLMFAASLTSVAQTHFCIAGDLDHLTQTEVSACHAKMTEVRDAIKRRGAPSGWHFVVVCDEAGWSDYASFSGKAGAHLLQADFQTDRDEHWTFLRGSHLPDGGQAAAVLLKAALVGVPGRLTEPGLHIEPQPMPNPERTVQVPVLQVAEVRVSDAAADAGQ